MEHGRELPTRRPVTERVNDWFEIYQDFPETKLPWQGARCMDCGVPFCHTGCPSNTSSRLERSGHRGRWKDAFGNCTPPIIFRNSPAYLSRAVRSGLRPGHQSAAGPIKQIERVSSSAVHRGWIGRAASAPQREKGGSCRFRPAGLAAAQQLCRAGHASLCIEG